MVFECNLPHGHEVEMVYQPDLMKKLCETVDKVHARHELLNKALALSGLNFGTFHKHAMKVWKNFNDTNDEHPEMFDALDPQVLANMVLAFYTGHNEPDFIEWPNAVVLYDTAFVSTKDWEALRHLGIGGSESSILQDVNHYTTKEGLWFDKLGYPDKAIDHSKQAIFDRGHFMEDRVIDTFCKRTGSVRIIETRMFRSRRYPHATANIDAIIRTISGELAIFEAKSAMAGKKGDWMGTKIPPNYITQMYQYAAVLDDDRIKKIYIGMIPVEDITIAGDYVGSAYSDREYFSHCLERDLEREDEILAAEEEFWNTYIVTNVKPDVSLDPELDAQVAMSFKPNPITEPGAPAIELKYADHKELLDQLRAAERAYTEVNQTAEIAKKKRDNLRLAINEIIGASPNARFLNDDGEPELTIKNTVVHRESVDTKTLKQFNPEIYELYKKDSSFIKTSVKAG